jgi:hypothetical protein
MGACMSSQPEPTEVDRQLGTQCRLLSFHTVYIFAVRRVANSAFLVRFAVY